VQPHTSNSFPHMALNQPCCSYVWCLCGDADAAAAVRHVLQWQQQRSSDAALPPPSPRTVIWLDSSCLTLHVGTRQVVAGGALQLLLEGGGGAEHLHIGFDFMGRSRGRGRGAVGLGAKSAGVGREAAMCFVAHIAASHQVLCCCCYAALRSSSVCSTGCCCLLARCLQQTTLRMEGRALKRWWSCGRRWCVTAG
jgi:hypothetical protein